MSPHDWIDYINACSTAVIAVFTILLFVGVVSQIRTSKTIERAWVMADVEPNSEKWRDRNLHVLEGSGTSGDSTAVNAILVCTNAGKSPAWINETRAKFEIVETLPLVPNFESAEYIEAGTIPLGMVEGGAVPHTQRLPWTPTAVGHGELGKMSVIYGFVRYKDIFKKPRVTTFAYRIIGGQLKTAGKLPRIQQKHLAAPKLGRPAPSFFPASGEAMRTEQPLRIGKTTHERISAGKSESIFGYRNEGIGQSWITACPALYCASAEAPTACESSTRQSGPSNPVVLEPMV